MVSEFAFLLLKLRAISKLLECYTFKSLFMRLNVHLIQSLTKLASLYRAVHLCDIVQSELSKTVQTAPLQFLALSYTDD